jgi:hypothetical protein
MIKLENKKLKRKLKKKLKWKTNLCHKLQQLLFLVVLDSIIFFSDIAM